MMVRSLCVLLVLVAGCGRRSSILDPAGAAPGPTIGPSPVTEDLGAALRRPPAGTSCAGRSDCASDQVCVEGTCRHRETSVAGEILAEAAHAQADAGDWEGANATFDEAIAAFETARAPVPGELLCRSAALLLRTASTPEARERAARRADRCFRASLPGDPIRREVAHGLSRLRFEGLDAALFDRSSPAETFFSLEPSRPTLDALSIDLSLPDGDESGLPELREALSGEPARRAVGLCFQDDWALRGQRTAVASLVVHYSTHPVELGAHELYAGDLSFEPTTVAEEGFEPCVARALSAVVSLARRSRVVDWNTPLDISVSVE